MRRIDDVYRNVEFSGISMDLVIEHLIVSGSDNNARICHIGFIIILINQRVLTITEQGLYLMANAWRKDSDTRASTAQQISFA